jgi:UDP-glucuronate 4-epimerase
MNLLEECKRYNLNIIYASSSSVYGDSKQFPLSEQEICKKPLSLYGATKLFNEQTAYSYSHLYNISSIGLRFFTVYGPWGRPDMALFKFTKNIIENKKINVYNKGNHSRSFTYIDDIVNAIESLLENYISKNNFYEVLNIGGEKSVNLMDFIKVIENKLSTKAKINFMPKQLGDVEKTESDCSRIASLVNYKPKVSIDDGISYFIDWYKEYYL